MIPALETLLPHRRPMLLLDSILSMGESEIIAETTIEPDAFFLRGHYPDYPIVPGVITCECLFQAGAALLAQRCGTTAKVPVIARIQGAKFKAPIRPGDQVYFLARIVDEVAGVFFLKGEARVHDRIHATVEFSCALTEKL